MQNSIGLWLARLFGLFLLAIGATLAVMFGQKYARFEFGDAEQRLQILWEQDVEKLSASGKLPKAWNEIKEIQLIPATDNAKLWLKNVRVPIRLKSDGGYKMEILVVSWEEEKASGAIMQYNLVDLKTNNMIWELGRTFVLSGQLDESEVSRREETLSPTTPAQPVTAPKTTEGTTTR
ncbi:MAG: hypothetical protein AB7N80_09015 [Bdellovibrionales bacterium]